MTYRQVGDYVELRTDDDFDLERIFECGQCFRWNADEKGVYTGVAYGRAAKIYREGDSIFISGTVEDFENIWRGYFDLDRSYADIRAGLCVDEYMTEASTFGAGIRILYQEKWEALCSFIISQCNNIPRIKKIVETLCRLFGDKVTLFGEEYYTFPSAEKIAALTAEDLAPLRSGYRAPYIINAAKMIASGELDLEKVAAGDPVDALKTLKTLNGVGDKVANCVVLFGLQMLDAFPIDVWMKKALKAHYEGGFDPKIFAPYAGIAQQYMFYFARSGKDLLIS
ncbi:MAG: DNA-3-methyladenine glycosylase 2 family protein [Oscillospiraceae bacterium]|nr:DNA-3-methyladenine glycosylase 2 family protein [Oscillospiraceae bacterium]